MAKKRYVVLCYDYQLYPEPIEITTAIFFSTTGWVSEMKVNMFRSTLFVFKRMIHAQFFFMKTPLWHLRVSEFSDNNGRHDVVTEDIFILISGFAVPNSPLHHVP